MTNDVQLNWLLSQGLIPLFGASIVYLIWGAFKKLAAPRSRYSWKEAIDSMGWLYGAIIIAVQSAILFFEAGSSYRAMGFFCAFCAMLCGMQLLVAMDERGMDPGWQPPFAFKILAIIFVTAVLSCGYFARSMSKSAMPFPVSRSQMDDARKEVK